MTGAKTEATTNSPGRKKRSNLCLGAVPACENTAPAENTRGPTQKTRRSLDLWQGEQDNKNDGERKQWQAACKPDWGGPGGVHAEVVVRHRHAVLVPQQRERTERGRSLHRRRDIGEPHGDVLTHRQRDNSLCVRAWNKMGRRGRIGLTVSSTSRARATTRFLV
jgi:hypothetical protein